MAAEPAGEPAGATGLSPDVLARWERDLAVMHTSIGLMLSNRVAEADAALKDATREVEAREIDFAGGEHDLRGGYAFVGAIMHLLNGLASLENNQMETVLERMWAADELLCLDGDWAGKTVLRGLCLLVVGLAQVVLGSITRGVWHILRSWLFLRYLESDGLNFAGHERGTVRSTSLLALGVFNLFASLLPPQAMRTASWVTGFQGGREVALAQLRMCWEEGGIQAPFAALALVGFAVDVSSFLGEGRSEREGRCREARRVLDWANEHHPGSFFFGGLEAHYLAATRDLAGALARLDGVASSVAGLPAFLLLVHVRTAVFRACSLDWRPAADAFASAVEVHRSVGRRALCPTLALNAHLCYSMAGERDEAARLLEICLSYTAEEKKWGAEDRRALSQARAARAASGPAAGAEEGAEELPRWRPKQALHFKICVKYRGVNFMSPEQAEAFLALARAETEACGDDADGRCMGLFIEAEALRQLEAWDEALAASAAGLALADRVSPACRRSGCLHFMQLVAAHAHQARGGLAAAKAALEALQAMGREHELQRQVEFKATHLQRLVGAELEDSYLEVLAGGRSTTTLLVDVPADTALVEWDWVLADFSINFVARFRPAAGGEERELQRLAQHHATAGPVVGSLEPEGPGRLELVFDNSFSLLRGKTVQCRVQPSGLKVEVQA